MDFSNMRHADFQGPTDGRRQSQQQSTRYSGHSWDGQSNASSHAASHHRPARDSTGSAAGSGYARPSPTKKEQKHVVFQLIDPEDPRIQARLPMRVMISPHDTTDSIITTVKNFYGLYEYGVSFENREGISIIAAFDNFENDMVVYVRTVAQPPSAHNERAYPNSPSKPTLGAAIEMRASHHNNAHSPSRTAARSAMRSRSPHSEYARRSVSAAPARNSRAKSKSKDNSVHDDADGYSSDDGANGSVTSSRRSRTEQVNAEISVNNIVEGGRRQRAFESSELPLFVPPQVPMTASISSVSPQRRNGPTVTPYAYPNQQTFSYTQPLPSPQSHGSGHYQQNGMPAMSYGSHSQPPRQLRGARPSNTVFPPPRLSGDGILPTPDPTINSVISDEDVALQLMRLGDASNFSHGRTSTSTVDDAFSGKAEAPSSDEEDDDAEEEVTGLPAVPSWPKHELGPQRKKQRMHEPGSDGTTGDEYDDQRDGSFKGESDEVMPDIDGQRRQSKPVMPRPRSTMPASLKSAKPRTSSMVKPKMKPMGHSHSHSHSHSHTHSHTQAKVPMSPASLPSQSRKTSAASTINFQHALGTDEEDLSSKPRCQRCRKSKKGCDRQRPCGRCKDAGIGIEGCVSEDEGNGRKGRYGRHMGVPVKRGEEGFIEPDGSVPPMSIATAGGGGQSMPNGGYFLAPAPVSKEKKRKR